MLSGCGCSSIIVMRRLIEINNPKKDAVMKRNMQAVNITTNMKVKIFFTFPELRTTKILMWNFNIDDFANGRYDMILGRYILTSI